MRKSNVTVSRERRGTRMRRRTMIGGRAGKWFQKGGRGEEGEDWRRGGGDYSMRRSRKLSRKKFIESLVFRVNFKIISSHLGRHIRKTVVLLD